MLLLIRENYNLKHFLHEKNIEYRLTSKIRLLHLKNFSRWFGQWWTFWMQTMILLAGTENYSKSTEFPLHTILSD